MTSGVHFHCIMNQHKFSIKMIYNMNIFEWNPRNSWNCSFSAHFLSFRPKYGFPVYVYMVFMIQHKISDPTVYNMTIFEQIYSFLSLWRHYYAIPEIIPLPVNCQKTPGLKFFLGHSRLDINNKNGWSPGYIDCSGISPVNYIHWYTKRKRTLNTEKNN